MFTGIVQDVGRILALQQLGGDTRLTVGVERLDRARSAIGDSIAVAGVCLTAVALEPPLKATQLNLTFAASPMSRAKNDSEDCANEPPIVKFGAAFAAAIRSFHVLIGLSVRTAITSPSPIWRVALRAPGTPL